MRDLALVALLSSGCGRGPLHIDNQTGGPLCDVVVATRVDMVSLDRLEDGASFSAHVHRTGEEHSRIWIHYRSCDRAGVTTCTGSPYFQEAVHEPVEITLEGPVARQRGGTFPCGVSEPAAR